MKESIPFKPFNCRVYSWRVVIIHLVWFVRRRQCSMLCISFLFDHFYDKKNNYLIVQRHDLSWSVYKSYRCIAAWLSLCLTRSTGQTGRLCSLAGLTEPYSKSPWVKYTVICTRRLQEYQAGHRFALRAIHGREVCWQEPLLPQHTESFLRVLSKSSHV